MPAPRFTKFLHGVCALLQNRTKGCPYWYLPEHGETQSSSSSSETLDVLLRVMQWDEMAQVARQAVPNVTEWALKTTAGGSGATPVV